MGGENKILQIFFKASPIEILCSDHRAFRGLLCMAMPWIVLSQCDSPLYSEFTRLYGIRMIKLTPSSKL
jgi:hypothetical protein